MSRVIRAVLFDLDGTMVDNMQHHIDAWVEMGKKLGHALTREHIQREFSGRKNEELFPSLIGRPLSAAELQRLSDEKEARYRELFAPHVRLLDGLEAFLDLLAERGSPWVSPPQRREATVTSFWSALGSRLAFGSSWAPNE